MSKPAKVLAGLVIIAAFVLAILSSTDAQAGIAFFFLAIYAAGACLLIWLVDAVVRAGIAVFKPLHDDDSSHCSRQAAR